MIRSHDVRAAVLAALGLLAGACGSLRVAVDSSPSAPFASYRTFDWVAPADTSEDARFPGLRKAGRAEILAKLTEKGYRKAEGDQVPDFRVQFYAFVESNPDSVESVDVADAHTTRTEEEEAEPPGSTSAGVPNEEAPALVTGDTDIAIGDMDLEDLETGDLVLEAVDGPSKKLVWRGRGQGVADAKKPLPELLQALDRVLDKFPDAGYGR